jgi:hypothetical protein
MRTHDEEVSHLRSRIAQHRAALKELGELRRQLLEQIVENRVPFLPGGLALNDEAFAAVNQALRLALARLAELQAGPVHTDRFER